MSCNTGPSLIIRGTEKAINFKITQKDPPKDPYDFTTVDLILAQFPGEDETVKKWYLKKTGNITTASDLITNINTENIEVGQLVTGVGIPLGTKVLYTPSSPAPNNQPANTIRLTANATATTVGLALVLGDILIVGNPLLGKLKVEFSEAETLLLKKANGQAIELKLEKASKTDIVKILNAISVEDSLFVE